MSYYYLAASLPMLVLGDPAPFSFDEFRASSSTLLREEDLQELDLLGEGRAGEGLSSFSRRWFNAETQLRNAVARVRGGRHGVDAKTYLRDHKEFSVAIEEAVTDAYAKPNPLERELELDRLRWQALDELGREEPFGLSAILAFAVKLQLTERWARMDDEAGKQKVEDFVDENLKTGSTETPETEISV